MIQNVNSGLYLEVDGGKAADGTNVQQWGANEPAAHNTWRVLSDGDGYYTLYPQIGDKVSYLLDVAGNAAANGTNLGIWSATDADAQRFKFYEAADGVYYLLTKTSGDQSCVAVQGASASAGANVVEWAVNLSDTSQQWKLTQVEDTGCVMDTTKTYQFRNANSNLYLEVANGKAEDSSNVQQWGANEPAAHNSWTLKEFGGGYYYILSALADGKTYYLNSAGEADGSNIEIHTNNKSSSHLFKFVKNPDGTYTILTRTSKDRAAVEVANAEKSSGANVQQWTVNGNACQKWDAVAFTTTAATTTTTTTTTTTATAAKTTAATVPTTTTTNTSKTTATSAQEQTTATTTVTTLPAATSAATETETAASTQATVSETTAATTSLTEQDTTTLSSVETTAATSATTATESSGTSPTTGTVIFGDVNLDGKVDISDAVLLNKTVAGTISLSESAKKNADCDGDGETGSNDAVVLLRFLVHLIQTLPSTE